MTIEQITAPYEALGQSDAFLAFQEHVSRAASVNRPVLLLGERGAGKEAAAFRLHYLSPRWQEPFVTLNCAALAASLIESELFGHEAGAFTGAVGRRTGRFEAAQGGTLFLDELGAVPLETQAKILRVVEYGVFERVGGSRAVQADVRLVGAANADLAAMARAGRFKQDLLDRLSFEVIYVPPLRERPADIPLLTAHFAARMAGELGREPPVFSDAALEALMTHPWPGNVRELKNVVERAVYRCDGEAIDAVCFNPFEPPWTPPRPPAASPPPPSGPESAPADFEAAVEALQVRLLRDALRRAKYNQRRAAQSLGLTYHQFRGYYRKFGKARFEAASP